MDAEYFSGHQELRLRTDLLNLHVYICAPEVLMLFSDNFDYQVLSNLPQSLCATVRSPCLTSAYFYTACLLCQKDTAAVVITGRDWMHVPAEH